MIVTPLQNRNQNVGGAVAIFRSGADATDYGPLQAVQVWWSGQTSLKSLVAGGKLWHLEAPEGANVEPYVTFFRVAEVPVTWTTGYAYRETTIQVNVHGATAISAETIAWNIAKTMSTLGGTGGAQLTIRGQSAIHVLPSSFNTILGEGLGLNGRDCWICSFEVNIPWTN